MFHLCPLSSFSPGPLFFLLGPASSSTSQLTSPVIASLCSHPFILPVLAQTAPPQRGQPGVPGSQVSWLRSRSPRPSFSWAALLLLLRKFLCELCISVTLCFTSVSSTKVCCVGWNQICVAHHIVGPLHGCVEELPLEFQCRGPAQSGTQRWPGGPASGSSRVVPGLARGENSGSVPTSLRPQPRFSGACRGKLLCFLRPLSLLASPFSVPSLWFLKSRPSQMQASCCLGTYGVPSTMLYRQTH